MRIYDPGETVLRLALLAYAVAVTYFSLFATFGTGGGTAGGLPVLHLVVYLGMALLASFAFPRRFASSRTRIVIYVFSFGLLMELLQLPLAERYFALMDVLFNAIGAGLVWFRPYVENVFHSLR